MTSVRPNVLDQNMMRDPPLREYRDHSTPSNDHDIRQNMRYDSNVYDDDIEPVVKDNSGGLMTTLAENKMLVIIVVLCIIILLLLAYTFFRKPSLADNDAKDKSAPKAQQQAEYYAPQPAPTAPVQQQAPQQVAQQVMHQLPPVAPEPQRNLRSAIHNRKRPQPAAKVQPSAVAGGARPQPRAQPKAAPREPAPANNWNETHAEQSEEYDTQSSSPNDAFDETVQDIMDDENRVCFTDDKVDSCKQLLENGTYCNEPVPTGQMCSLHS